MVSITADEIMKFVNKAVSTFSGFFDILNKPIEEFPHAGLIADILLTYTDLGDFTLLEMFIGGGVIIYVIYALLTWIGNLIT